MFIYHHGRSITLAHSNMQRTFQFEQDINLLQQHSQIAHNIINLLSYIIHFDYLHRLIINNTK